MVKIKLLPVKQNPRKKVGKIKFLHTHALKPYENVDESEITCKLCQEGISGQSYGCSDCDFFLHKSCAEIQRKYEGHFLHPECHLKLKSASKFCCNACDADGSGFAYHCKRCDFYLHVKCAKFDALKSEGKEEIRHLSHLHPLTLLNDTEDHEPCCEICRKSCSFPTWGCSESSCKFYLHKSCIDTLPPKIDEHPFHASCSLILLRARPYHCGVCDKECSGLAFHCRKHYFQLCVECSLLPTIDAEGLYQKIRHFLHKHPLTISEKERDDQVFCKVCHKQCLGITYGCDRCNFILHDSCAKLPHQIQSSHHSSCRIILFDMDSQSSRNGRCNECLKDSSGSKSSCSNRRRCHLCLKNCSTFAYCCEDCHFTLDVECASLKPTIKYADPIHLLVVLENIYDELDCSACKTSCIGSPAFRCLHCNFNLHLLCGPLPHTIAIEDHLHPLTLKDIYLGEHLDFICNVCEEERDPRQCVYYCSGCRFVSEIKCIIPEILASLRGQRGSLILRSPIRPISRRDVPLPINGRLGSTEQERAEEDSGEQMKHTLFYDIIESLTEEEKRELGDIFCITESQLLERVINNFKKPKQNNESRSELSHELDSVFSRLMDEIDSHSCPREGFQYVLVDHDKQPVKFGAHIVPYIFVPILEDLYDKYGDVAAESMLTARVKSVFLLYLCELIYSMRSTLVIHLTKGKLHLWWKFSKLIHNAGFNIQFIFEHIKILASAYCGLEAEKSEAAVRGKHARKVSQLTAKIKELTEELEATEEKHKSRLKEMESARKGSMRQHFANASAMKLKRSADGFL